MSSEATPSPATATTATPLGDLMTPAEVAQAFGVDPKTVARWARSGKLSHMRTLGGHRRYLRSEVEALLKPPGATPPV